MPCPPSYEEQQASRAHYSLSEGRAYAARLIEVLRLLDELVEAGVEADEEVRAALALDIEPRFMAEPDWWGNAESSAEVLAWADAVHSEKARLELALCEASTALVCAWDRARIEVRTEARQKVYAGCERHHRDHRERDRKQVLRTIKRVQGYLEKGGAAYKRYQALRKEVKAIPIEVLLRDRSALPQV